MFRFYDLATVHQPKTCGRQVFVNGVASCTEQACTGTHLARAESAAQAICLSTVRLILYDFITAKNPFLLERSNECHFD